jgi:hypothetical protein
MSKKWLTLTIVLILLATTVGTALAKPLEEVTPGTCPHTKTVNLGKQGFYSSNPDFPCQTNASNLPATSVPAPKGLKFVRSVMNLQSKTTKPRAFVFAGKTQAFFDLNPQQAKAWKAGTLAVYFLNKDTHTWSKMPSFQQTVKGKFRIASNIFNYGYYALAKPK